MTTIKFEKINVLVVGDLMLDEYIFGKVNRISPEAPVPVVWVTYEHPTLGGAGNVVNNLAALGASVSVIGSVGYDPNGGQILDMLEDLKVDSSAVQIYHDRPTTTKTRIVSSNQQLLRIDREDRYDLTRKRINDSLDYIEAHKDDFDAVILSDYGKGVLTKHFTKKIIEIMSGKFIAVDPTGHDYVKYKGATIATPNLREAEYAANMFISDDKNFRVAAKKLTKYVDNLLITRGKDGLVLFEPNKEPHYVDAKPQEVYDVSGAGDTVISVLTLAAASGFLLSLAAEIANVAAGIVVGKLGTATVSTEELAGNLKGGI